MTVPATVEPVRFGQLLRKLRKARGLTLTQLGSALAVSPTFLSDVERSTRRALALDRALRAAQVLGATQGQSIELLEAAIGELGILEVPAHPVAVRNAAELAYTWRGWLALP
jgi:transcriptional regulator with XRE-family HTH domain